MTLQQYFSERFSGQTFQNHEDMQYEWIRLQSFAHWPSQVPDTIHLARSGFYYSGEADRVICFSCKVNINDWRAGVSVDIVHKLKSPTCLFMRGLDRSNKLITASDEGLAYIKAILGPFETSPNKDTQSSTHHSESSLTNDQVPQRIVPDTQSFPEQNTSVKSLLQSSQSLLECLRNVSDRIEDVAPIREEFAPFRSERRRLESYINFPAASKKLVEPASMAKAGFYYTGFGDRVQCVFCSGILRNWELGDIVFAEHRKHFPSCPFVMGLDVGNIPIEFENISSVLPENNSEITHYQIGDEVEELNATGLARDTERSYGYDIPPPFSSDVQPAVVSANRPENISSALGIITEKPKFPLYAIESKRLATFENWPPEIQQRPEQLVQAGFIYIGKADNVKCFFCNGGLKNWDPDDIPWVEHARWFPTCPYVRQVKGETFINTVKRGKIPEEFIAGPPETEQEKNTADKCKNEIEKCMNSSVVKSVLDLGLDRDLVIRAIENKHRSTPGQHFNNTAELVEAVFSFGTSDSESESVTTTLRRDCPVLIKNTDVAPQPKQSLSSSKTRDNETTNSAVTPGHSDSVPSVQLRDQDLLEENRQLREQRTCKICMDQDVSVVFLPCGHLVCCASCAPALKDCPICRKKIRGIVKTFIS